MKLIALTHCKYGQKRDAKGDLIEVLEAQPGEEFSVDEKTAKALLENGGAATPEDYEKIKAAAATPDQINAELAVDNAALREENAKLKDELAKAQKK